MKKFIHFGLLGLFCVTSFVTFEVQAADKAAAKAPATPIEELNYKYEKLVQLNYQRHNEIMKVLKEIREQGAKKAEAPAAPVVTAVPAVPAVPAVQDDQGRQAEANATAHAPAASEPSVPASSTTTTATELPVPAAPATSIPPPTPPAVTPEAQAKPVAGAETDSPVNVVNAPSAEPAATVASAATPATAEDAHAQPMPQTAAPVSAPEVKAELPSDAVKKLSKDINNANSFAILAFLVSVISLISMGILIATVRKSDEKIRRMLWKSEVDNLRDEVISGRPQLKVEKSYDRLILTNVGTVVADDIKLSLGPAPRTMKQRLRVLARIEANEKAEVDIGPQQATDGQIYGTLEYKNPENAKLFKEQFILKVDGVTGELVPVQQAI